jgi:hypothetical protein
MGSKGQYLKKSTTPCGTIRSKETHAALLSQRKLALTVIKTLFTIQNHSVRKMDPILRSIQRMLQTQITMVRKFTLRQLRKYSVKHSEMCNFASHLA